LSLDRFFNRNDLLQLNIPEYGQTFSVLDLSSIYKNILTPNDPNIIHSTRSELHIFSFIGDYIAGDHDTKYLIRDSQTNSLLVNVQEAFSEAGITRGSYRIIVNLFKDLYGSGLNDAPFRIKEISPDRTEVHFSVDINKLNLQQFQTDLQNIKTSDYLNSYVFNFGSNKINKVINLRLEGSDLFVKFYNELEISIQEKELAWCSFEVIDPYVDSIILTAEESTPPVNKLRGPNFNLDTTQFNSNATIYKTWNDLLDSDTPTTQRIIDSVISGSGTATLNIDYSDFENYIFYSSATERLNNFIYKLELIEGYQAEMNQLNWTSSSLAPSITNVNLINQERIDNLRSNFDHWERWLYYHGTSSLFTHDRTGSITPYPKYLSGGQYIVHHTTSSLARSWYQSTFSASSDYDRQNMNRLWWSIPEHILMDSGSSDYVIFVDMVAQHYDVMYSYVKALTQIHERDEHPERGPSTGILYDIAKSFGWNLQNTRADSSLWLYKLGTNQSGSYDSTGSLFSTAHENQTFQVWRRLINNLPYLLKTKGTERSIKALMSIYGIPNTLMSIKEYGGPSIEADKPAIIEDRFSYTLNFTGSQYIELERMPLPYDSGSWNTFGNYTVSSSKSSRVPNTIEFIFNTQYSGSVSQSLWAIEQSGSRSNVWANLQIVHQQALFGTSSYSGSHAYGYLKFNIGSDVATSSLLPLYDNDFWTVRIQHSQSHADIFNTASFVKSLFTGSVYLNVARVSDNIFGRISFSSSVVITGTTSSQWQTKWLGYNVTSASSAPTASILLTGNAKSYIVLGGTTGSNSRRLIGNIHGYKEYFETYSNETFYEHVLNPGAYHVNNETSSFYSLYRNFPLGLDVQRFDHSIYTQVSSSQPNRRYSFKNTASFVGFTGSQSNQYDSLKETYYVYVPSLGGNVLRKDKIRIEGSQLQHDLSPTNRSEKSAYDKDGFDTNRLAIVFSPSDQVNRDIYNHMGFSELDSWIGDPQYEYDNEYSELKRFSQQYWQKYQQKYDINAFIRLCSLYDYSFFEQIKQLVPGRADLIAGILIEPNVLERSKVIITRLPSIENPQWEDTITKEYNWETEYPVYEGNLQHSQSLELRYDYIKGQLPVTRSISSRYDYFKGSLNVTHSISSSYNYFTASIKDYWTRPCNCSPVPKRTYKHYRLCGESLSHLSFNTGSACNPDSRNFDGLGDNINVIVARFSGSTAETQSVVYNQTLDTSGKYWKVIYYYSGAGSFPTRYEKQWYAAVSESYKMYYSRSLEPTNYQVPEDSSRNNSRFIGCTLSSPDWNIDSKDTIDGGPVVTIWESNPNNNGNIFGNDGNILVQ